MQTWGAVLAEWLSGKYPTYPTRLKYRFFYETSVCTTKVPGRLDGLQDLLSPYQSEFVETRVFDDTKTQQDFSAFGSQITANYKSSKPEKYALAFGNIGNTSMLIIPVPKYSPSLEYKNFMTIRDFMDNASITHQREFWKTAAKQIMEYLKTHDQVWVSTHGLGVPYFHLRLDPKPKYYKTKFNADGTNKL